MVRKGLCKMQRRFRAKKKMVKFVDSYSTTPLFILFIMRISQRVIMIQKWFRRYLVKKHLSLAIMNMEWTYIEHAILKLKITDKSDAIPLEKQIAESIRSSRKSDVVPVPVRLHYIKAQLNVKTRLAFFR